jgi:hypothetical protein
MTSSRRTYPSDVSDDEYVLVIRYLTVLRQEAGQRELGLREVFNGLRSIVDPNRP